jgi:hypothetical protein
MTCRSSIACWGGRSDIGDRHEVLLVAWTSVSVVGSLGLSMEKPDLNIVSDEELWNVACHEGGHVAIAVHYGFNIDYVEIKDDGNGIVETCGGPIECPEKPWTLAEIVLVQPDLEESRR